MKKRLELPLLVLGDELSFPMVFLSLGFPHRMTVLAASCTLRSLVETLVLYRFWFGVPSLPWGVAVVEVRFPHGSWSERISWTAALLPRLVMRKLRFNWHANTSARVR